MPVSAVSLAQPQPAQHVAALSFLPTVLQLASGLMQSTGLQSTVDLYTKIQDAFKGGQITPAAVDSVVSDVKSLLSAVGPFVPGGGFAVLEAELNKYLALADAVASGQSTQIGDYFLTLPNGQRFDLELSLTAKAGQAAAAA